MVLTSQAAARGYVWVWTDVHAPVTIRGCVDAWDGGSSSESSWGQSAIVQLE